MFTNCIYEAANGIIWVGTREGFYCFNEKEKKIKRYTTANGLPNNVVYGILEDTFGRLWVSTNRGISCFNPETEKFRNFTESDGLQSNQFNTSSFCRTSNGQMYFGGINGITTFRPELLLDNPYTPPVVITKLQLFNKTVRPDDETGILTKNINETESITLKSWQTAFTLEFVASNYISGQHNTFAYKLEGYDKEWYYLTDKRTVSYSNLPQGTYHFLVKAANSDGKWNTVPTMLEIVVLPIWYKTWWAIVLFLAIFIGFITFVFRFFWMRKSMEAELEIERRDKEHQEEINQMKMRFFINISHELRTPLTLILAPLQEIINKISDRWTRNQLEYIQRNANRLLHLVNQLMDYRRAELGVFELKAKRENAHQLIQDNFLFYDKLARHKKITYTLHSELEDKEELFDPNYLELIVNNLLSNAFKYTESGQSITVTLKEENNWLVLQVSDTGIGIPINKQGKIFERFYQIDNDMTQSNFGTGIGLHLSRSLVELHHGIIKAENREDGQGTRFVIRLPLGSNHLKAEELENPEETGSEPTISQLPKDSIYETEEENKTNEYRKPKAKTRYRVLIVEDDEEIRRYIRSELDSDFRIYECTNGREGLETILKEKPDLVISDVMMPEMDGITLCRKIKQNININHIPIILLTAKSKAEDQIEGLEIGADAYIVKPFNTELLRTTISNLIANRERLRGKLVGEQQVEEKITKIEMKSNDEILMSKVMKTINDHLADPTLNVEMLAANVGMSRVHMHRKLKELTNQSARDFIRSIRLKQAANLLREKNLSVSEVAYATGFSNLSHFSNTFRDFYGISPSEYKEQQM